MIVDWKWHYHVPGLGLWVTLPLLLVLVPANRNAQAWLIFLPVFAVALGWSMLARLLFLPPEGAEVSFESFVAMAASWSAVWLLAPWLARYGAATALTLAVSVMLAAGALFYGSSHLVGSPQGPDLTFSILLHAALSVCLVVAHVLAAAACRHEFRLTRFARALLVRMILIPMLCAPVVALLLAVFSAPSPIEFLQVAVMASVASLIVGGFLGGALYVVNLPFLFLVQRNPYFAARFHRVLRLTPATAVGRVARDWVDRLETQDAVSTPVWKEP